MSSKVCATTFFIWDELSELMISCDAANKKELVTDLVTKAKQIEVLIHALPVPESEEEQVRYGPLCTRFQ